MWTFNAYPNYNRNHTAGWYWASARNVNWNTCKEGMEMLHVSPPHWKIMLSCHSIVTFFSFKFCIVRIFFNVQFQFCFVTPYPQEICLLRATPVGNFQQLSMAWVWNWFEFKTARCYGQSQDSVVQLQVHTKYI